FAEGIGFDGSAIEGFSRAFEADTIAQPDPSTFQILPFGGEQDGYLSARMFCDITMPDGQPSWADPRQVLRRQLAKAAEDGFSCNVHPEIEFFLVKSIDTDGQPPVPADNGGYFDQAVTDNAPNFRADAINSLERMGIPVEFSHHENGPGQQEIDLRFADALTMADHVMTFRYLIKQVARRNGVRATFMPKPVSQYPGSAMHTHISLFEGEDNAFHAPDDEFRLSATAKSFIAGILEHAPEFTAVTNQWVNSYKRISYGEEAPRAASWGASNRSAMVRIPMYTQHKAATRRVENRSPDSAMYPCLGYAVLLAAALVRVPRYTQHKAATRRVEIRSPDSAMNPYLGYAVMLAAGLKGIREGYELPAPAEEDVSLMTRRERIAAGFRDLPTDLDYALRKMERSEMVAEALGEHVFEFFLRNKWQEWHAYQSQISPWELRHHLEF